MVGGFEDCYGMVLFGGDMGGFYVVGVCVDDGDVFFCWGCWDGLWYGLFVFGGGIV